MSLQMAGGAAVIDQSRGSSRFVSVAYQISTHDPRVDGAEFHPVWPPYDAPLHIALRGVRFSGTMAMHRFPPKCDCPERDSIVADHSPYEGSLASVLLYDGQDGILNNGSLATCSKPRAYHHRACRDKHFLDTFAYRSFRGQREFRFGVNFGVSLDVEVTPHQESATQAGAFSDQGGLTVQDGAVPHCRVRGQS